MRILLVEDTEDLADAILRRIRKEGHAIDWESDGIAAEEVLRIQRYDLVILDITLPRLDGYAILNGMRQRNDSTPVLVLTARSEIEDRVSALDLGADDYLVKPFDFRELDARCRALLRRARGVASGVSAYGNLVFDRSARIVTIDGRRVYVPKREYRMLEIFLSNLGRVLSKRELGEQLFGFDDEVGPNAIELYVARLRRRLQGTPVSIRTLRGLGYVADVDA
jgi:two-component system response regulator TctD